MCNTHLQYKNVILNALYHKEKHIGPQFSVLIFNYTICVDTKTI